MLDGKEISETAKKFLLNWKANREARKRHLIQKEKQQQQQQKIITADSDLNAVYFQALPPPVLPAIGTSHHVPTLTATTRDSTFSSFTGSQIHRVSQTTASGGSRYGLIIIILPSR